MRVLRGVRDLSAAAVPARRTGGGSERQPEVPGMPRSPTCAAQAGLAICIPVEEHTARGAGCNISGLEVKSGRSERTQSRPGVRPAGLCDRLGAPGFVSAGPEGAETLLQANLRALELKVAETEVHLDPLLCQ